jgi:hypothetical protein
MRPGRHTLFPLCAGIVGGQSERGSSMMESRPPDAYLLGTHFRPIVAVTSPGQSRNHAVDTPEASVDRPRSQPKRKRRSARSWAMRSA